MATVAASEPLEPSEMECSVCHEYFTQPKILPCAHLLCQHCLVSWLHSHPDACCPLCRCAIVDPQERRTRRSAQEVADALPTDVAMAGLVAAARALSAKQVCAVCENMAAHFTCLDCNMLCQACKKEHTKQSATKHNTTAERAASLAASRHVNCTAHAEERAKLTCSAHDEFECHIRSMFRQRAQTVLSELLELLTGGEIQLEAAIRELDDHLLQVEKKTERTLADITATCDDLKKAVDAFGSQMREAALSAKYKAREEAEQVKSAFMQRKGKLTSHKLLVKRTKRVATSITDRDVTKPLKTMVDVLDRSLTFPSGVNIIAMPTLVIDQQAIERVQKELKGVCKLEITPAKLAFNQLVPDFCFHDNHGKNIVLSNNKRTAKRRETSNPKGAVVVSSQQMEVHLLYEVVIDQVESNPRSMMAGVTAADPASLTLPGWAIDLPRESSVILCNASGWSFVLGTKRDDIGKKLKTLPVGGRVGFYVDAKWNLHLVVDGCDQGVVCEDVPQPCYAVFGVAESVTKVTALAPRHMIPPRN